MRACEWLFKAGDALNVGAEMRSHWLELRRHRHYVSHANSDDEWQLEDMREFARERRFARIKTVELWKATTALRQQLRPEDQHWLPTEVRVDYSMAVMTDLIYRSCLNEIGLLNLPPIPQIFEGLTQSAADYVAQLRRRDRAQNSPPAPGQSSTPRT